MRRAWRAPDRLRVLLAGLRAVGETTYIAFGLVSVSYHWNNFLWPLIVTNLIVAHAYERTTQ